MRSSSLLVPAAVALCFACTGGPGSLDLLPAVDGPPDSREAPPNGREAPGTIREAPPPFGRDKPTGTTESPHAPAPTATAHPTTTAEPTTPPTTPPPPANKSCPPCPATFSCTLFANGQTTTAPLTLTANADGSCSDPTGKTTYDCAGHVVQNGTTVGSWTSNGTNLNAVSGSASITCTQTPNGAVGGTDAGF